MLNAHHTVSHFILLNNFILCAENIDKDTMYFSMYILTIGYTNININTSYILTYI